MDQFVDHVSIRVGEGDNTSFWHDRWTSAEGSLRTRFGRLYDVSEQQQSQVKDMGEWAEGYIL